MNFKSTIVGKLDGKFPIYFDGTMFYIKTKNGNMALDNDKVGIKLDRSTLDELL